MAVKNTIIPPLDEASLPNREGVYLARGIWGYWDEARRIDVYMHPLKGLSCFSEDFGSGGTDVDDRYDCHVSVQNTGLIFTEFVSNLRSHDVNVGRKVSP